jgi:osmotically-inducible protein OsmY
MRVTRGILTVALAIALAGVTSGVARADTPDAWITAKTKIGLMTTKGVDSSSINVDTVDGRVTLHGKVDSAEAKQAAEDEAKKVSGVKEVRNLLQVVKPSAAKAVNQSDDQLKKQVSNTLGKDASLKDSSITVSSVNDGVVLLSGKASSVSDHLRAVEDASRVPGVRRVASEVQSPDTLADEEIRSQSDHKTAAHEGGVGSAVKDMYATSAAKLRLLADSRTPATDINVDTRDGVVTLFGTVPTAAAKKAAEDDVHRVAGVHQVKNELQIVPTEKQETVKARDEDIKRDLKTALDNRSDLKDADINADVKNGVARLTGTVRSEEQRLSAAVAARSTPGVRSVEQDLNVSSR